jgi:hypothetical protein
VKNSLDVPFGGFEKSRDGQRRIAPNSRHVCFRGKPRFHRPIAYRIGVVRMRDACHVNFWSGGLRATFRYISHDQRPEGTDAALMRLSTGLCR